MVKRHVMTARRKAALKRAQLASARKRRRGKRINKRIKKVTNRTNKRITKQRSKFTNNLYTTNQGGVYTTKRGVKAYNKANKIRSKGERKVAKLRKRKRR